MLTSRIKRGDVAVFEVLRAVVEGRFRGGVTSFGLAEGGVGYGSDGPHAAELAAETKARVDDLAAQIGRGEIEVPSR